MIATLPIEPRSNAVNLDRTKEMTSCLNLVGIENNKPIGLVTVRFYMARRSDGASPVYCALWVHDGGYPSGKGRAGGYGYCKKSAAMQDALDSAGITLWRNPDMNKKADISGVGSSAMRDALIAIGEALGYSTDSLTILEN